MKNHHDHCDHDHDEPKSASLVERPSRAFQISIVFNLLFVLIEFYYGYLSQSLSLFGDALHNLGDVFALGLSWLGFYLARSQASEKLTFGFKKFSILAAFFNAAMLIGTSVFIIFEAYERFQNPQPQNSLIIMAVAAVGFVINMSTALLFHGGHKHDLNIKSAYIHLLGDAIVSLGVVVAGAIIYFKQWNLVDPIVSVVIAVFILGSTWGLFRESVVLMLNGVPQQVNFVKLSTFLESFAGVSKVEQLRVWAISTSEFAMTAKLHSTSQGINRAQLEKLLEHDFNIKDVTIQIN